MNKHEKREKYCSSCRDNFYNGNNDIGVKECWCLENSKVVFRKLVHRDARPPWNQKAVRVLDCYHRENYITLKPEITQ